MKLLKPASFSILLLSAWIAPSLPGQIGEENLVEVKFTTLNWAPSVIRDLKFESDSEVQTATVYNRGLSIPVNYKGPANLVFFRETAHPQTGEMVRTPVAQTRLPKNLNEVLLVFQKKTNSQREFYRVYPIPRNRKQFPRGSYQIFNFSDFSITGKIDDEMFTLAKQDSVIVELPAQQTTTIEVKFARSEGDEWKLAYSSLWGHKTDNRVNIFMFNSDDPVNPIEIRRYKEFVPAEQPAEEQ
ncbi:hypothetical protein [Puniceicoccus vermicola]|uniref:Uncharacterized protein n=1 Tax=Puniceicoccus vermicola TaxID=388746 RepID=A0A7X1B0H7_9BACT|nr:hypothetical protein [Puniceicoccus vermicola]MBC2602220.1 hypothetical protein [Puniceicoccus vermicola]